MKECENCKEKEYNNKSQRKRSTNPHLVEIYNYIDSSHNFIPKSQKILNNNDNFNNNDIFNNDNLNNNDENEDTFEKNYTSKTIIPHMDELITVLVNNKIANTPINNDEPELSSSNETPQKQP